MNSASLTENWVHLASFRSLVAKHKASQCLDERIPQNLTRDLSNIRGLQRIAVDLHLSTGIRFSCSRTTSSPFPK